MRGGFGSGGSFASVLFARLGHELDGPSHGWESPREEITTGCLHGPYVSPRPRSVALAPSWKGGTTG